MTLGLSSETHLSTHLVEGIGLRHVDQGVLMLSGRLKHVQGK